MSGAIRCRPILFSAPMIQALLAGRKTMTRRIVKHPERFKKIRECGSGCPYGGPGDQLWVREAWAVHRSQDMLSAGAIPPEMDRMGVAYLADLPKPRWAGRTRPGIHMPRWASRLILQITDVGVERVGEITDTDARAEGVVPRDGDGHPPSDAFVELWTAIHGRASWDENPWVWVISFRVVEPAFAAPQTRRSA